MKNIANVDGQLSLNEGQDYCTFHVNELFFGIPANQVVELSRDLDVTFVPKGPVSVSGLMNLRGQLVPAINMHIRLGLDKDTTPDKGVCIILSTVGGQVALIVDSVGEIISLNDNLFEQPPNNMSDVAREVLSGVYKLPDKLLLLLDPLKIMTASSMNLLSVVS